MVNIIHDFANQSACLKEAKTNKKLRLRVEKYSRFSFVCFYVIFVHEKFLFSQSNSN